MKNKILFSLLVCLSLISCQDKVNLEIKDQNKNLLVVDAFLTKFDTSGSLFVRLTESNNYTDTLKSNSGSDFYTFYESPYKLTNPIKSAIVYLESSIGEKIFFSKDSQYFGWYGANVKNIKENEYYRS